MEGFFACSSPLPYYIFVIAIRISRCGFRSRIGRSFTTQHLLRKLNVSLRRGCAMARPGSQARTLFTLASFYSRVRIGPLSGFCKLTAHLGHKLAHGGDITWRAAFDPGFVALRSFFQVRAELLVHKPLPSLRNDGLDAFPDPEKFATGLKE